MPRQPVVGADSNAWGAVLNAYLSVAHNADGSIRNLFVNVTDPAYGADPTGVADSTTAIQAALNAAGSAGGGVVLLPPGTYKTSASLVFNNDSVILRGAGFKNTTIKPASGAQFDVISTPIPASAGLAGFTRNFIGLEQLMIDCGVMTGTTAGQGNGIHLYGTRYSFMRDLFIQSCPNLAILIDGDNTRPGNSCGYDNQVMHCIFDLCAANFYQTGSENHDIVECRFKWATGASAGAQPALGTQDTVGMHIRCAGGYMNITGNVLGLGGNSVNEAIRMSNAGPSRIIGNRFDQVTQQAIVLNGGNTMVIGNQIGNPSSVGTKPGIQIGSSNNTIIGNKFDNTNGAVHYTYCIAESGGPFSGNIIEDNNLLSGTTGYISQNATSTNKIANNPGYNPVGFSVTQPAVPASTVTATNNSGVDCTVYIAGGTITQITVGGTNTGLVATPATVRVPAGMTIAITYTGAPTWKWWGD